MTEIKFAYPYMLFEKCDCTQQVPITSMNMTKSNDTCQLTYSITCPYCGRQINPFINVSQDVVQLEKHINVYKVIPLIKDELAIIRLDSVKAKMKNDQLLLFGNYSHLRFFDNLIQHDIIKINYAMSSPKVFSTI